MVERIPSGGDGEMDWDEDDGDGDWDEWADDPEVDYEEPKLNNQGSSFNNALEIYSTKTRKDVNFVDGEAIAKIL